VKQVTGAELQAGFERLGIVGKRVAIHSSFKSFGQVMGGPDAIVDACVDSFETILTPAFCFDSNAPPPPHDRPRQNGCNYSFYDNWPKPPQPFIVETARVDPKMGVISQRFASLGGAQRSDHAWHSWAANGAHAKALVNEHPWDTTNLPLERLSLMGGQVVLMGVNLSSCTAIHIAEERAGLRPFIRWATDRNGMTKRVRAAGCAKSFNNLMPHCEKLFSETYVGECKILAAPLNDLIEQAAMVIKSSPQVARCSEACLRCRDAILGGPIDD
jgi:aminoglycoside 3-N-acetyltransferase